MVNSRNYINTVKQINKLLSRGQLWELSKLNKTYTILASNNNRST